MRRKVLIDINNAGFKILRLALQMFQEVGNVFIDWIHML